MAVRELKVLSAGAVKRGVAQIAKEFERESGNKVTIEFATAPEIRQRVAVGETADVIVAPPAVMDDIAKQGKIIFSGAYGLADRDKGDVNTPETRFRNGSMNKMITAVAILQLAQADRVKLAAPLGTYITDYPNKDIASKVTIFCYSNASRMRTKPSARCICAPIWDCKSVCCAMPGLCWVYLSDHF